MKKRIRQAALTDLIDITVRFGETDAMNIAWHGSYVKYLEDGRESFGKKYGIGYRDIFDNGYKAPIVEMKIEYKKSVTFGHKITVETRYINSEAAKIIFDYFIRDENKDIAATASTVQVFIDLNNELQLVCPEFYLKWKKEMNIDSFV